MSITLYQYWRSSCSFRVRWALGIKSLSYETISINLLKKEHLAPEYLAVSPIGTVPSLVIDGQTLGESSAILEYLEEIFPEPALLPRDPVGRAKVRQVASLIGSAIQPLQNVSVLDHYAGQDQDKRLAWMAHWMHRGFVAVEAILRETHGTYCFGDALTLADLYLGPQCYAAKRFAVPLNDYPIMAAIFDRLRELPSYQTAAPEAQPDAVKA